MPTPVDQGYPWTEIADHLGITRQQPAHATATTSRRCPSQTDRPTIPLPTEHERHGGRAATQGTRTCAARGSDVFGAEKLARNMPRSASLASHTASSLSVLRRPGTCLTSGSGRVRPGGVGGMVGSGPRCRGRRRAGTGGGSRPSFLAPASRRGHTAHGDAVVIFDLQENRPNFGFTEI